MDENLRNIFSKQCMVLVRVFAEQLPFKSDDLIISTNNQNKMDPRNLKSNTDTQIHYEKEFSNLSWFYERKEKAWQAFQESDGNDTLPNTKAQHFGREKGEPRVIDNSIVATAFLAFSGFSDMARNEKQQIFTKDSLYNRIFERSSEKHGFDFDFNYPNSPDKEDWIIANGNLHRLVTSRVSLFVSKTTF